MGLRMVEMIVSAGRSGGFDGLAEGVDALGVWRETLDDELVLVRLLVASEKTDAAIEALRSRFGEGEHFRVLILEVQATLPEPEVESRDATSREEEGEGRGRPEDPARIACAELVQKLSGDAVVNRIFLVTVTLSTVVAAIGLLRDNVAAIIGAMVIAPLLTPNMTLALATTLGDFKLIRRAIRVNFVGMSLALLLSVAIGLSASVDPGVRQIQMRTEVSLADVALALAAGSAGALAFTTGLSAAVVGVMVAVALLPPVVNVGLLLGAGELRLSLGALHLAAVNVVCVNLAGVATFLWQRVSPAHWWEAERAKRVVRLSAGVWLGLLALLIGLIVLSSKS